MGSDVFKPRGKLKKNAPGAGVASVIQVPIIQKIWLKMHMILKIGFM